MESRSDKDLTVTVRAPRAVDTKEFTWAKTKKVGEAAKEAADAFGYLVADPTLQKGDEVLDRNKPLVAEGVQDGDLLVIVDAGGGVARASR